MYRFLKYLISFLLIWLLNCNSRLTAQYVQDYRLAIENSISHGPMASLSYEELSEIKEIFAAAKTEEETKGLWKTFASFIQTYTIPDNAKLKTAIEAFAKENN